jgi:hypothetical protein
MNDFDLVINDFNLIVYEFNWFITIIFRAMILKLLAIYEWYYFRILFLRESNLNF